MIQSKTKIVACLDMGTTKIICLIAAIDNKGIKLLGYGHKESRGIIASAISDMKLAQKSIINAVADAEKMAGFNIDKVVVALSASQALSQKRVVGCKIAGQVVKSPDIINLVNGLRDEYKKNNREVIHLIPLQYKIDDSILVHNPNYMAGEIISSKFHIVSTSATTVKNIENCLKSCQLSINNYISEPYASALAVLSENELNLGTLVIDIGGANTSFAVVADNKLVHTGNYQAGGIHITRDIAIILNIDFETAEKIKNINNSLIINPLEEREFIKLQNGSDDHQRVISVTKMELREIIKCRLEEIIESVKILLEKSNYGSYLISNIVLTGGCASIIGIDKIVSDIFKKQVRIGSATEIKNLPNELDDPSFCCSLGTLIFLRNIYLRKKIKDGFENKGGLMKRFFNYLSL